MRKFETWLTGLTLLAVAMLPAAAALEPAGLTGARAGRDGLAAIACDDGSAHLAMGCSSMLL